MKIMVDDVGDIAELYDGKSLEAPDRLTRHQLEHDLTWRYLNDYLPSPRAVKRWSSRAWSR